MGNRSVFNLVVTVLGLLVGLLFVVRIWPWAGADLWFDEIITLGDYALGQDRLLDVFKVYPVANNHVLFSAVLWLWMRVIQFNATEWLMRLPNVLFGLATVWVVVFVWRKWMGRRLALLGGIVMAGSPVFAAFAFTLRGYSLSMLLAAIAVHAAMNLIETRTRRGLLTSCLCGAALPLTIPANALVVISLLGFVGWSLFRRAGMRPAIRGMVPGLIGLGAGAGYYLTIWDQFIAVATSAPGWANGWAVLGHWTWAIGVHLGPVLVGLIVYGAIGQLGRRAINGPRAQGDRNPPPGATTPPVLEPLAGVLAICCLAVMIPVMLLREPAPFPRTFLAFLPPLTLALFVSLRQTKIVYGQRLAIWVLVVLINAGFWQWVGLAWRQRAMAQDIYPQNLVSQFYRGDTEISRIAEHLGRNQRHARVPVALACRFEDLPAVQYYSTLAGVDRQAVYCPQRSMPGEQIDLQQLRRRLMIIATNDLAAASLFAQCGLDRGQLTAVHRVGLRAIYRDMAPVGRENDPPAPPMPTIDLSSP